MTKKKKKIVSNKKKKVSIKKSKPSIKNEQSKVNHIEKAYGEPTPVKPLTYVNNETYPRLLFRESLWKRFLRFFGLVP